MLWYACSLTHNNKSFKEISSLTSPNPFSSCSQSQKILLIFNLSLTYSTQPAKMVTKPDRSRQQGPFWGTSAWCPLLFRSRNLRVWKSFLDISTSEAAPIFVLTAVTQPPAQSQSSGGAWQSWHCLSWSSTVGVPHFTPTHPTHQQHGWLLYYLPVFFG